MLQPNPKLDAVYSHKNVIVNVYKSTISYEEHVWIRNSKCTDSKKKILFLKVVNMKYTKIKRCMKLDV